MKDAAMHFLDHPLEEKSKVSMPLDDIQGYGHSFVVSEEQKLEWQDALALIVLCGDIVEKYSSEVRRVDKQLKGSISLNMGMNGDFLLALHKELAQVLRLNYYPPCSKPDQVLGFSPHSDLTSITIPLQDDDVTGLQIQHNGEWVPVKPISNALVVNVGDVIEIWSNGKCKSIELRAVTNENKARMSFASFFYPPDDLETEPLDKMVHSQDSSRKYRKVTYGDYLREFIRGKLEGKANIEKTKIEIRV